MTLVPTTQEPTVADLEFQVETLTEALSDAARMLGREDVGWTLLGGQSELINRRQLQETSALARVMAVADPLVKRGINLRIAYVWGQGVDIEARQDDNAKQDVNAVVQAFLDDPSNEASFTSAQAREEFERALATDGQRFLALPTSPLTGRVQVRTIPEVEVDEVVTDPEDSATPWYYKRTYTTLVIEPGYTGSTRRRRETRTVYYPALGFRPSVRPKTVDGKPVEWDKPVLHVVVNRPEGSSWGVPDALAALPWAQGYKGFLEDWSRLVKALSRFAFQVTAKSAKGAQSVRTKISSPNDSSAVGQTVTVGPDQSISAIGKSGATIDSGSGKPLAALVASALEIPVTMLLGDPGVTGARATAETLDRPLELMIQSRQRLHSTVIQRVLDYVIDQAIKAPRGPLRGTVTVDPLTRRETVTLAGDQPRQVTVSWPRIDDDSLTDVLSAIEKADGTQKMPPLVLLRLMLQAFKVEDVDEVLASVTDADGNFIWPEDAAAATSQQDAVRDGNQPKD